ncbi:MAG: dockerin type I domain-containing protein [Phycisphaerales bacterium]
MAFTPRSLLLATSLVASVMTAPAALAGGEDPRAALDFDELIARLGAKAPTGTGVVMGMVEARDGNGNFGPNLSTPELAGKNVTIVSSGAPGSSGHATTVLQHFVGDDTSLAPGVSDVYLWEAVDWINGFLRTGMGGGTGPLPLPDDIRTFNNSWTGSGPTTLINDAMRRADLVVERDDLLLVVGVTNDGSTNPPLLSHTFNALSVGVRDGTHATSATGNPGIDGPGRMKPEIVGAENFTSFATPQIGAIGAVLIETALTHPGLAGNLDADRIEVLRAAILASATKENQLTGTWSNGAITSGPDRGTTVTPIDDVVGVGLANVNRAHLLLTALEQPGGDTAGDAPVVPSRGWGYDTIGLDQSRFWRIDVPAGADSFSVAASWNRRVRLSTGAWFAPDLDLILWRVDAAGDLQPLTGDAGLAWFDGGNVTSQSPVDMVEHLHVTGLAAATYVLEVRRLDNGGLPPANWPFAVAWYGPEGAAGIPEDINGDGVVDFGDLLAVISEWGTCPGCDADIDGNGEVDLIDLLNVLAAFS